MSESPPKSGDDERMPLWQHLDELRNRIIRALLVLLAAVIVAYCFSDKLIYFLEKPLLDILPEGEKHLYFIGITEKFFVYLKVSVLSAIILVSPYLLLEIWGFVTPALYAKERRFVIPFLFLGTVAFAVGVTFAYKIVIPFGYDFLIKFGSPTDKAMITLGEYFDLTLKMMLAIGFVFELPVVLMLLGRIGIVNSQMLKNFRKHAFVANAFISAIATPSPDAFTMLLMMGPLWMLYELSIMGVRWVEKAQVENKE